MATTVRNLTPLVAASAVAGGNASRLDALRMRAGLVLHADVTTLVTAADITTGSTLAEQIAIVVDCSTQYTTHIASACNATTGLGAHMAADATNVITSAVPTTLAGCYTRINEVKALVNLHDASTTSHPVADATNTVSATDASTAATLATLANQVKAKVNGHLGMAMGGQAIIIGAP